MKSELILIGGGGHCKSCIDVIERQGKYRIAGIIRPRFKGMENVSCKPFLMRFKRGVNLLNDILAY